MNFYKFLQPFKIKVLRNVIIFYRTTENLSEVPITFRILKSQPLRPFIIQIVTISLNLHTISLIYTLLFSLHTPNQIQSFPSNMFLLSLPYLNKWQLHPSRCSRQSCGVRLEYFHTPMFSPSTDPVSSAFKIYPKSDLSLPLLLRHLTISLVQIRQ